MDWTHVEKTHRHWLSVDEDQMTVVEEGNLAMPPGSYLPAWRQVESIVSPAETEHWKERLDFLSSQWDEYLVLSLRFVVHWRGGRLRLRKRMEQLYVPSRGVGRAVRR